MIGNEIMNNWKIMLKHLGIRSILLALLAAPCVSLAQQISIPRVELMPNKPSLYSMRDWKQVAVGYDSLVFNQGLTGNYLPLVSIAGQNFSLSSYVGEVPSQTKEAINCIPAVVSASLVGVDKTSQVGSTKNPKRTCTLIIQAAQAEAIGGTT